MGKALFTGFPGPFAIEIVLLRNMTCDTTGVLSVEFCFGDEEDRCRSYAVGTDSCVSQAAMESSLATQNTCVAAPGM
jgi:hypothetical protein